MPGPGLDSSRWLVECVSEHDCLCHEVRRVLVRERTPFQDMRIVQSDSLGKALVLDGLWQTCEADEFLYHEPLVHPACLARVSGTGKGPERVLLLGGGDGGAAREVLRWDSVREAVMVDIDEAVVAACREHLPEIHQGAFDDPRLSCVFGDARQFVDAGGPDWDVIVSDLSDPVEDGPAVQLFTREFFRSCGRVLRPGGVFVTQAGMTHGPDLELHARVVRTLAAAFGHVVPFASTVPLWGGAMGFALASDAPLPDMEPAGIDALLSRHVRGPLRALDGRALEGMQGLPLQVRRAYESGPVYTVDDTPAMPGNRFE